MEKIKQFVFLGLAMICIGSCSEEDPEIPAGLSSMQRLGGWEQTTQEPPLNFQPVSNATVGLMGSNAYIMGAGDLNNPFVHQCWYYNVEELDLEYVSQMPVTVSGGVGFALQGRLYYGLGVSTGGMQNNFYWATPSGPDINNWNSLAFPSIFPGGGRSGAISFVINNKAYVGLGNSGNDYLSDLYEFNPTTMKWKQVASIPAGGRQDACVFVLQGKAYVCCGYNGYYLKEAWQYDPAVNKWMQVANLPGVGRDDAVAFAFEKRGYVGTGWNNQKGVLADFWEYNPVNNTWVASANLFYDGKGRYGAVAWATADKAFVATGNNESDLKDFWKSTLK